MFPQATVILSTEWGAWGQCTGVVKGGSMHSEGGMCGEMGKHA